MFRDTSYILPARLDLLRENLDTTINGDSLTIRDIWNEEMDFHTFDMGDTHQYRTTLQKALDEPGATVETIGFATTRSVECSLTHAINEVDFEK